MPNAAPEAPRAKLRLLPAHELKGKWSIWIAAFWSFIGALIIVLSAYLSASFDWRVGALIIGLSVTFGVARALKQPGTEQ
jgi:hypothetical protein